MASGSVRPHERDPREVGGVSLCPRPGGDWPPRRYADWARAVGEAGRQWSAWVEDRRAAIPELLMEEWIAFREPAGTPVEQLAMGHGRRLRGALLTLHAIADEACAGTGVALDSSGGHGCAYRARGRELLARTGSLARVNPRFIRVLPRVSSAPTGQAGFSRYACVQGPWHRGPMAQDARSSPRQGCHLRVRDATAAALADEGPGVRFPPARRIGTETGQGAIRLLR